MNRHSANDENASDADLWAEGIRLFNDGRFFDCHEVWERLWKRSSGANKVFYQGMIQAAVVLLHAERGNLSGSRSIWSKARVKFDGLPREHHGIALGRLRADIEAFIATGGSIGLKGFPKIRYATPDR
jgi:predicted metal-dependent hydrolase